jgi:hypothetical protein
MWMLSSAAMMRLEATTPSVMRASAQRFAVESALSEDARRFRELSAACDQRARDARNQTSKQEFDVLARLWLQLAEKLEQLDQASQRPDK